MLWAVRIGKAIDHYRKRSGLTQEGLAARAGINQSNVSRLIRGRQDPPLSHVEAIARALGVQMSELYAYAEGLDAQEARWRQIYAELSPDEREAALKIMDRGPGYKVTGDK